jgi:hypothetical protein
VLAQLAEHASEVGFNNDAGPLSFSIERHKEGMKAFSGQMFLELDEIANLMGRSRDIHEANKEIKQKENSVNNARLLKAKDDVKNKDGKNTLNDKILTNIETLLKPDEKPMRTMRFAQTGDKSKLKGKNPFEEDESSPFTENEGGGDAASQAAKALAEQMKQ